MTKYLFSLKDIAAILRTQPYRIVYQLTTGKVPEPKRIGGKRVFTLEDLELIAEQLGIENVEQTLIDQRGNDVE